MTWNIPAFLSLVVLIVTFGHSSRASDFTQSPFIEDAVCAQVPGDPYDPSLRFNLGPNRGKCLNTLENRSVVIVEGNSTSKKIVIANFLHHGKFWIATFDPSQIEEVYYQIEMYPALIPGSHNQMRFKFKEGFEAVLTPQDPSQMGSEPLRVRDVIFAAESVRQVGDDTFDLVHGFKNYYGFAYRVVSFEDKFKFSVLLQKHPMYQMILKLSDRQKEKLLRESIRVSDTDRMKYFYDTRTRNCTTEPFRIFDTIFQIHGIFRYLGKNLASVILGQTNPAEAKIGLNVRGLLSPGRTSDYPVANEDHEFIDRMNAGHP